MFHNISVGGESKQTMFGLIKQDSYVYRMRMRSAIKLADTLTLNAKTKWSGAHALRWS